MTLVSRRNRSESGLVLVAVLWIAASLALLLNSILSVQRNELREKSFHVELLHAMAGADSVIRMRLFELLNQRNEIAPPLYSAVRRDFEGRSFLVEIFSSSGLINIELASEALLVDLFEYGSGLDSSSASKMAKAVVDYRISTRELGSKYSFAVNEDLLKVPGMRYSYFQRIQGLIFAATEGSPLVNLRTAPLDVLLIIYRNDRRAAEEFIRRREQEFAMPELESVGRFNFTDSVVRKFVARVVPLRDDANPKQSALPVRVWWIGYGSGGESNERPWSKYWSYQFYSGLGVELGINR